MKKYLIYLFWIGLAVTTIGWTIAIGFYIGLDWMKDGVFPNLIPCLQIIMLTILLYSYIKFYLTHNFKIKEGG